MSNKQARISDYWNSDLEEKDVDFMEDSTATSSGEKPGNKRKGIEKENKNPMKKKAGGKIDGLTLTQHKRMLGDQVKSKLEIAGGKYDWHIKARCHLTTSLSREAFKAVVVPHVDSVTPAKFDDNTEVVLAEVKGMNQASAIFGSTKLRAGTRLGSWEVDKMDLVFRPKKEELRIWWTMN